MVAPASTAPVGAVTPTPARSTADVRGTSWAARLTSVPVLAIGLIVATMIAAGPMQIVDEQLNHRWILAIAPGLKPFTQQVLDRIAGQAVCLPVLAAVAGTLAYRRRSWRPIVFAICTELAFFGGIGGLKFLLARPAPTVGDAAFLEGGFLEFGEKGISFPSGHASEAVLIYGAAVFLIHHYSSARMRTVWILRGVVALITVNSVVVSFVLGWHWATDLIGGVLAGGLFLRILAEIDLKYRPSAPSEDAQEGTSTAPASATDATQDADSPATLHLAEDLLPTDRRTVGQVAEEGSPTPRPLLRHNELPAEEDLPQGPAPDGLTTWRDASETLSQ